MLEVRVLHPVGEALSANTNTFKHTVTGELMHNQVRINETYTSSNPKYYDTFLTELHFT
jgi:hypothetical protein